MVIKDKNKMIKLIKKVIRRLILEIIWRKNKLPVFLFKGKIKIESKVRFYQPLILGGGGDNPNR